MTNKKDRKQLIKNVFGKSDPDVRKQLYNIMKDNDDFKSDLKRIKGWMRKKLLWGEIYGKNEFLWCKDKKEIRYRRL